MRFGHLLSARRLRFLGRVIIYANTLFFGLLLVAVFGRFKNAGWIFYLMVVIAISVGLGWIVAAFHLWTSAGDEKYKSLWWGRLLFSGPMASGWYLSSLKDD
jgi:hypothetical protein